MRFENFEVNKIKEPEKKEMPEKVARESGEQRERIEDVLDQAILKKYQKIDEGHNGVIGLVDLNDAETEYKDLAHHDQQLEDLDDDSLHQLFQERFGELAEDEDRLAIKMLKIFSTERAENELSAHSKVYDLLEQAKLDDEKSYASVPKLYFNRSVDLEAHPDLREKLGRDRVMVDKNVNVLAMDFLQGENLDYYLHKETLLAKGYGAEECEGKDYRWMQLQLSGLGVKGFSLATEEASKEDAQKINRNNLEAMARFLASEKKDLIATAIFDKVKNTLDLAHENGVFHRDLHERNLFLELAEDRRVNDVVIIDWGEAKILESLEAMSKSEIAQVVYDDGDGLRLSDEYIFKYDKLLNTQAKEIVDENEQLVQVARDFWSRAQEMIVKKENSGDKKKLAYDHMKEELAYLVENESDGERFLDNVDREFDYFASVLTPDDKEKLSLKTALWLEFVEDHQELIDYESLRDYLASKDLKLNYLKNDQDKFIKYLQQKIES